MMASQTSFCKFVTVFGNFRSLVLNRPAITNCTQVASLRMETREKIRNLPEKPKKPLTPFFLYLQERKEEVRKSHPDLKITQVAKKLSEEWNKADASIKQKYEARYKKSMEGYLEEYLKYDSKLTEEQKNTIKEIAQEKSEDKKTRKLKQTLRNLDKPKRPKGPFIYFIMEYYEKEKAAGVKFQDFMKKTKSIWENISKEEKQKYVDMYLDDKKRYEMEMELWEAKMIKTGHADLVRQSTLTLHSTPIRKIRSLPETDSSGRRETASTKNPTKKRTTASKSSKETKHKPKQFE